MNGGNDDSDFLWALYSVLFFRTEALTCVNKDTSVLLKVKNI